MSVGKKQRMLLAVQRLVSRLCFPILYPLILLWLKYVKKYRIKNIKAVRQQFKQIKVDYPNGLLICPNHLTYIDSMLLIWGLSSAWQYFIDYKSLSWNLPKSTNVHENWLYRVICFLGKCILIAPEAEASKQTMLKASYLLNHHQCVTVFPEGSRSQTGRINSENFVYGVGQLHIDSSNNALLCVYLRGDKQQGASKMPVKSESFSVTLKMVDISTELTGRRAMRDVAKKIIDELLVMEADYFRRQANNTTYKLDNERHVGE